LVVAKQKDQVIETDAGQIQRIHWAAAIALAFA